MWGTGVDDRGTIPYYYNSLNKNEIVLNHGESGFVSRQSLARLVNLFNQGQKSYKVIFYDGYNDITTMCRADIGYNSHDRAEQINFHIKNSNSFNSTKNITLKFLDRLFIYYTNKVIQKVKNRQIPSFFDRDENNKCCFNPNARKNVANTMINNWLIAKDIVESRGGRFYAILQPSAYTGENVFHKDFKIIRKDCMQKIYDEVCDIVRDKLKNESWFLDLTLVFNNKGPFYIDAAHISDYGNEIIANEINSFINN